MYKTCIALIIFILGLYYILNINTVEPFQQSSNSTQSNSNTRKYQCPNVLIQKGNKFYLHNNKVAKVPGVNPLRFDSLEDYTEFLDWQRSQGIICPIMYVRESYDAQGNRIYNVRPSPTNLSGGLQNMILNTPTKVKTKLIDSNRTDPPFNDNSYPGYDKYNQYIGIQTPLDKMYHDKNDVSPNPMDPNWGGHAYTKNLLDSGYFKDDEVWAWH